MRRLPKLFAVLLLSQSLSGCLDDESALPAEQDIYFEVNYDNRAWGEVFRGFLIDREGKVRKYDNPAGWQMGDNRKAISYEQMNANLTRTAEAKQTVTMEDLAAQKSKIAAIGDSAYTKPVMTGADIGIIRYYAYRYEAEKGAYIPLLLMQDGDRSFTSKDPKSQEIAAWLKSVQLKIY